MTRSTEDNPGDALRMLLDELERLWKARAPGHLCVMPASITPAEPVGRYAWPSAGGLSLDDVTERVGGTKAKFFVAARNITMHDYSVTFTVTARDGFIRFLAEPQSSPIDTFKGEIVLDGIPPVMGGGPGVPCGCRLLLSESFSPASTLECVFVVEHEGAEISRRSRNLRIFLPKAN